ncbi:MlaA family lipoprotein [Candidatus Pantoea carbekii]|uniref:VacJ protein n=1 Tax=Candidatus Pantoea carbekii TaxID=1235990 RepID=U3U6C5_9GAMM|nr:MlaA family lipoprotein [Candidatus Pantoea carbekii]AKC31979.1 lipoprotein VacJ precursor [Candidatus Pantoea carbekii]BAO00500.1 VacJ protein [Candidatus Pantoea carbekii]
MKNYLTGLVLASIVLTGCANSQSDNTNLVMLKRSDPFEYLNRIIFKFNHNTLDHYVIRPMAVSWRDNISLPARTGLSNFLSNLDEPASMINALLIGKPRRAMISFTRFFLNSTIGLGGWIDVAGKTNSMLVREEPNRFGGTLGKYNISYGSYIELPIYGSFTMREDGGSIIDMLYPALSWLTWPMSIIKWTLEGLEMRVQLLDSDAILNQQKDPYSFWRNAYFQRYDFIANGGKLKSANNCNVIAIQEDIKSIDS